MAPKKVEKKVEEKVEIPELDAKALAGGCEILAEVEHVDRHGPGEVDLADVRVVLSLRRARRQLVAERRLQVGAEISQHRDVGVGEPTAASIKRWYIGHRVFFLFYTTTMSTSAQCEYSW